MPPAPLSCMYRYAVQCRLRRQQYKESLEIEIQNIRDEMKKVQDELSHAVKQRYAGDKYLECSQKIFVTKP